MKFPDTWGIKQKWPPTYNNDVTNIIIFAHDGLPYVKRSDIALLGLGLGDLVTHKSIAINGEVVIESRLGASGYQDMEEYMVLNGPQYRPDESDKQRNNRILERLKKKGL